MFLAAFIFIQAAEQGSKEGNYNLALAYELGYGVEKKSKVMAERYYSLAGVADKGSKLTKGKFFISSGKTQSFKSAFEYSTLDNKFKNFPEAPKAGASLLYGTEFAWMGEPTIYSVAKKKKIAGGATSGVDRGDIMGET